MKKIGIFYGSTTGTTQEIATMIADRLGVGPADVRDVAKSAPTDTAPYDVLLLGASTWGSGDLQEDMDTFLDGLQALDLQGKEVAIFGCGDEQMADTFCNSVGEIYHRLKPTGCMFIAPFNNDGYTYEHSEASVSGLVVGLCIDQTNHPEETAPRINAWCDEITKEIS